MNLRKRELNRSERYIQRMLDGSGSQRYKIWLMSKPIEAFVQKKEISYFACSEIRRLGSSGLGSSENRKFGSS